MLAGVLQTPRSAPQGKTAQVLEIKARAPPASQAAKFSENLDNTYRKHEGFNLEKIKLIAGLPPEVIEQSSYFGLSCILEKPCSVSPERTRQTALLVTEAGCTRAEIRAQPRRFRGSNYCLGLRGVSEARWPYSITLMGRTDNRNSLSQLRAPSAQSARSRRSRLTGLRLWGRKSTIRLPCARRCSRRKRI